MAEPREASRKALVPSARPVDLEHEGQPAAEAKLPTKTERGKTSVATTGTAYDLAGPIDEGGDLGSSLQDDEGAPARPRPEQPPPAGYKTRNDLPDPKPLKE